MGAALLLVLSCVGTVTDASPLRFATRVFVSSKVKADASVPAGESEDLQMVVPESDYHDATLELPTNGNVNPAENEVVTAKLKQLQQVASIRQKLSDDPRVNMNVVSSRCLPNLKFYIIVLIGICLQTGKL